MRFAISPRSAAAGLLLAFLFTLAAGVTADRADAQATRTWVSGNADADDVNPCSRSAPCRTLAGAISKTAAGGEINAITAPAVGALNITKAITIDLSGTYAGIAHSGTDGLRVMAGATDDVVLRGIDVRNVSGACALASVDGISVETARSVRIEDMRLEDQAEGVRVAPASGAVDVSLDDVEIRNTCNAGVNVEPAAGASADVSVDNTSLTQTGTAIRVADRGRAWVTRSVIFGNALGLQTIGTGSIDLFADARVYGNTVDGSPTRTLGAPAPGANGLNGANGSPGPRGPAGPKGEPAAKLVVALPRTSFATKRGKRVNLRYLATTSATARLQIRKGRRVVAFVDGAVREGMNTIRWNGKRGRRKAAPGRYTLRLQATSADGQVVNKSARLRIKR